MKAEDLDLQNLFRFSRGLVSLLGRRVVIHDLFAMGQFRRDLVNMVGQEHARRICTRMGYFWGQADASALKRSFHWESAEEMLKAGPVLNSLQGAAQTELKILSLDRAAGRCSLEFTWQDSSEAEAATCEPVSEELPCCWVLSGYASGFCSFCLGFQVYFIETRCRARGDSHCLAEGRDAMSWDKPLSDQLVYYQTEDIRGKIDSLASKIQQRERELAEERQRLEQALYGKPIFPVELRNQRFVRILQLAERAARFDSSILITGETGVGKEVLARLIHRLSTRASGPFVPVSCTALSETLIESELFGHKSGAFTGATRDQSGFFEEAEGGTIFLDEIGDISSNLQLKLLRVLQEHEVIPLGETRPRRVDVRVIAATNQDLERKVKAGQFRDDLYYRLKVVLFELPPLRERREDILPLARHILERVGLRMNMPDLRLDSACVERLLEYSWPGNIRELENTLEHAAIVCSGGVITPEDLPPSLTRPAESSSGLGSTLEEVELAHIRRVLESVGGNRAEAARRLGIGPATLYRKLRQIRSMDGN